MGDWELALVLKKEEADRVHHYGFNPQGHDLSSLAWITEGVRTKYRLVKEEKIQREDYEAAESTA